MPKPKPKRKPDAKPDAHKPALLLARERVNGVIRLLESIKWDNKTPAAVQSLIAGTLEELQKDIQFQDQERAQVEEILSDYAAAHKPQPVPGETTLERVRRTGDLRDVSYNDLRREMQEERERQEAAQLGNLQDAQKVVQETLDGIARDLKRIAAGNSFPWVNPNKPTKEAAGSNDPVEVPWLLACAVRQQLRDITGKDWVEDEDRKEMEGLADQLGSCIKRQEEGKQGAREDSAKYKEELERRDRQEAAGNAWLPRPLARKLARRLLDHYANDASPAGNTAWGLGKRIQEAVHSLDEQQQYVEGSSVYVLLARSLADGLVEVLADIGWLSIARKEHFLNPTNCAGKRKGNYSRRLTRLLDAVLEGK